MVDPRTAALEIIRLDALATPTWRTRGFSEQERHAALRDPHGALLATFHDVSTARHDRENESCANLDLAVVARNGSPALARAYLAALDLLSAALGHIPKSDPLHTSIDQALSPQMESSPQ